MAASNSPAKYEEEKPNTNEYNLEAVQIQNLCMYTSYYSDSIESLAAAVVTGVDCLVGRNVEHH